MATTSTPPRALDEVLAAPPPPARRRELTVAELTEPVGWTLASLTVLFWGLRLWAGTGLYSELSVVACVLTLSGMAGCVAAWTVRGERARTIRLALVALWAVGFAGHALLVVTSMPAYGTDALAFNQRAAELLLDGQNPYAASLADSLQQFLVPDRWHTWRLDGGEIDRLSYPALAFLVYVPAVALGGGMQTAFAVNVVAWIATIALLYAMLPARLRWAAPVLGSLSAYVEFAVGGVTDMVFLPFLLVALWRWDRFGDPAERSPARWAGPVALALAMCIKQTPWFVLPLVLIGLTLESRAAARPHPWRVPLRYAGVVAGVFAAVNLPFLAWNPGAFVQGMLLPFLEPTVPAGQGLIPLTLFAGAGGPLAPYKAAGLLAVLVVLLAWALGYRRLKPALVPLVALVFFWSTRSFASYLIDLLPAALVAGVTVRAAAPGITLGRLRLPAALAAGAAAVAFAASVALALASPAPLDVDVVGMRSTGQQQSIREITVRVRNHTGTAVEPVFSVMSGAYLTRRWQPASPAEVPAHGEAQITLVAPNQQAMPSIEGGWTVAAFTRGPDAVSTSPAIQTSTDRLTLEPAVINAPVALGEPVALAVQLRNRLGMPQRRAGVPVALGQVVYTEVGLLAGETSINGSPRGQSPVVALTDERGVAHFTVVGETAHAPPVFFQAWINPHDRAPYAYSEQLSIRFTERSSS